MEKWAPSLGLSLVTTAFPMPSYEGHGWTQQGTLSYLDHKQVLTVGYPSTIV